VPLMAESGQVRGIGPGAAADGLGAGLATSSRLRLAPCPLPLIWSHTAPHRELLAVCVR
jgi:hypothetical protein